jgi:hypothetical protein
MSYDDNYYKQKYLKYKNKYLELKGGVVDLGELPNIIEIIESDFNKFKKNVKPEQVNTIINIPNNNYNNSILMVTATKTTDTLEKVKYLVENGANVTHANVNFKTVLYQIIRFINNTSRKDQFETIKYLFETKRDDMKKIIHYKNKEEEEYVTSLAWLSKIIINSRTNFDTANMCKNIFMLLIDNDANYKIKSGENSEKEEDYIIDKFIYASQIYNENEDENRVKLINDCIKKLFDKGEKASYTVLMNVMIDDGNEDLKQILLNSIESNLVKKIITGEQITKDDVDKSDVFYRYNSVSISTILQDFPHQGGNLVNLIENKNAELELLFKTPCEGDYIDVCKMFVNLESDKLLTDHLLQSQKYKNILTNNPNFRNFNGKTPIIALCSSISSFRNLIPNIGYLLNYKKIDLDLQDGTGHTALMYLIKLHKIEEALYLIKNGLDKKIPINLNIKTGVNNTSLLYAMLSRNDNAPELFKLLIEHGADWTIKHKINIKNKNGDIIKQADSSLKIIFNDYKNAHDPNSEKKSHYMEYKNVIEDLENDPDHRFTGISKYFDIY